MAETQLLAGVLIRGREVGMDHDVKQTLDILRMRRKNVCVVVPDNLVNRGLFNKVKDFIAYGPVDAAVLKELQEKRGSLKKDGKDLNVFRMHPPRGGFARKGTKVSYQQGGVLGLRAEKMADLLKKMM